MEKRIKKKKKKEREAGMGLVCCLGRPSMPDPLDLKPGVRA